MPSSLGGTADIEVMSVPVMFAGADFLYRPSHGIKPRAGYARRIQGFARASRAGARPHFRPESFASAEATEGLSDRPLETFGRLL